LEIDIGVQLYAIFKANALTINSDISLKKSDVNRFIGKITRINRDSFNAEIIIELDNKNSICSTMSVDIFDELHVGVGTEIVAFCRPKNIILGRW
jgi:molybdate transport system regulatory protein